MKWKPPILLGLPVRRDKPRLAYTKFLSCIELSKNMNLSDRQKIEQKLLELDRQFLDAILHHNVSDVDRILPDDFLSVFPNGRVADKADELENVKTVELESYSTDEVKIHWYKDDLAIINFRLSLKIDGDTKQVRDSHVYAKRDERWQMIMGQTTPIFD